MAIDAGVPERQVHVAERTADLIAAAYEGSMLDEGVPPEQAARIVARFVAALTRLEGGTVDGVETRERCRCSDCHVCGRLFHSQGVTAPECLVAVAKGRQVTTGLVVRVPKRCPLRRRTRSRAARACSYC